MVVYVGCYSILDYMLVQFDSRGSKVKNNVHPSHLVRCTNTLIGNRLQYTVWVSFVFSRYKYLAEKL